MRGCEAVKLDRKKVSNAISTLVESAMSRCAGRRAREVDFAPATSPLASPWSLVRMSAAMAVLVVLASCMVSLLVNCARRPIWLRPAVWFGAPVLGHGRAVSG